MNKTGCLPESLVASRCATVVQMSRWSPWFNDCMCTPLNMDDRRILTPSLVSWGMNDWKIHDMNLYAKFNIDLKKLSEVFFSNYIDRNIYSIYFSVYIGIPFIKILQLCIVENRDQWFQFYQCIESIEYMRSNGMVVLYVITEKLQ